MGKKKNSFFRGGSKTPVDGIISIFRFVDLIRIIGIAQSAVTSYPYIQPTIIPTFKNEVSHCFCLTRKSDIHDAIILFVTYVIRSYLFSLKLLSIFLLNCHC